MESITVFILEIIQDLRPGAAYQPPPMPNFASQYKKPETVQAKIDEWHVQQQVKANEWSAGGWQFSKDAVATGLRVIGRKSREVDVLFCDIGDPEWSLQKDQALRVLLDLSITGDAIFMEHPQRSLKLLLTTAMHNVAALLRIEKRTEVQEEQMNQWERVARSLQKALQRHIAANHASDRYVDPYRLVDLADKHSDEITSFLGLTLGEGHTRLTVTASLATLMGYQVSVWDF